MSQCPTPSIKVTRCEIKMGSKVGNGTQRGFFSPHFTFLVICLFVSLHIQHSALISLLAIPTVSLQALQDLTTTKINRRLVLRSRIQSVLVSTQVDTLPL